MIDLLVKEGCNVRAYGPGCYGGMQAQSGWQDNILQNMYDAILDADALLLLTEWKEFRLPSWEVIGKAMRNKLVIDGRNIYDPSELDEAGFEYHCIGRWDRNNKQ